LKNPEGDFIGILKKCSYLTVMTTGCRWSFRRKFCKRVAEYLEAFDVNRDFKK
jgi:hypothetical protein